jgi:hypothetical protein
MRRFLAISMIVLTTFALGACGNNESNNVETNEPEELEGPTLEEDEMMEIPEERREVEEGETGESEEEGSSGY